MNLIFFLARMLDLGKIVGQTQHPTFRHGSEKSYPIVDFFQEAIYCDLRQCTYLPTMANSTLVRWWVNVDILFVPFRCLFCFHVHLDLLWALFNTLDGLLVSHGTDDPAPRQLAIMC